MRKIGSNKCYNILIINRFFVSLQCKAGMFVFVLAGWLMAVDGHAQTSSASPFNTIGECYRRRPAKVRDLGKDYRQHPTEDSDLGEPSDTIDAADVLQPPRDSLSAYLPMVALPLRRISVSSPFGFRMDPMDRRRRRMHSGLDLRAHYEPVFSMLPGTVTTASYSIKGGYYVTIDRLLRLLLRSSVKDTGQCRTTRQCRTVDSHQWKHRTQHDRSPSSYLVPVGRHQREILRPSPYS